MPQNNIDIVTIFNPDDLTELTSLQSAEDVHITGGKKITKQNLINDLGIQDTDLSIGNTNNGVEVLNSNGDGVTIPQATNTADGVMTWAEKQKLAGIEANASADQTPADIKAAYESNANTNEFTDAEKTKLGTVEANAEQNVQSDWDETDNTSDSFILNKPTIGGTQNASEVPFAPQGNTTSTNVQDAIEELQTDIDGLVSGGGGDMLTSTYDTNSNGTVDNSEQLEGNDSAFHRARTNHTGEQPISTVTGLQAALDGKAAVSHTHTKSEITDFNDADYATQAQGQLADTAVQPGDLAAVATTGDYTDLVNTPTIIQPPTIIDVNQTGIGTLMVSGDIISQDATSYIKANATDDTKTALGVVVEIVDADNIKYQTHGRASYTKSTLTKGTLYYLDTTDGNVTSVKPNNFVQPIFEATSTNEIDIDGSLMFVSEPQDFFFRDLSDRDRAEQEESDLGNVSGDITIDLSVSNNRLTIVEEIDSVTFTNLPAANKRTTYILNVYQDASGGYSIDWTGSGVRPPFGVTSGDLEPLQDPGSLTQYWLYWDGTSLTITMVQIGAAL